LPKGFQTAEFVQEHGFLDFIVDRREMKEKLASFLKMLAPVLKKKKLATGLIQIINKGHCEVRKSL
jgi:acetyl-CoA carboxylase beta subunit